MDEKRTHIYYNVVNVIERWISQQLYMHRTVGDADSPANIVDSTGICVSFINSDCEHKSAVFCT